MLRGDVLLAPLEHQLILSNGLTTHGLAVSLRHLTIQPSGNLLAQVRWSTSQQLYSNYQASWKLYDKLGRFYAELDTQPGYNYLPTSLWEPNTQIKDWVELRWLADDGIEPYSLVVSLRNVASGELVYQDEIGRIFTRDPLTYGPTKRHTFPPTTASPINATFGDQIALRGYNLERYGNTQAVTLYWKALADNLPSYSRFVHLVDVATGEIVAQTDTLPQFNTSPTDRWQADLVYNDVASFDISHVPTGEYELRVGLYSQVAGEFIRLPVADSIDDALPLPEPLKIAQ